MFLIYPDGRRVEANDGSELGLAVTGFHRGVDLVTFFLGEVCVATHSVLLFLGGLSRTLMLPRFAPYLSVSVAHRS